MSSIAEHRHLVDIMRPLAPTPRPQLAANWAVTCPRCGHDSVHLGPNGRYCERGECEWEAQPAPLAVHGCACFPCDLCGAESASRPVTLWLCCWCVVGAYD